MTATKQEEPTQALGGEVICSECDEVIDYVGRVLVFPFVCKECREVAEYNAKHLPQEHVKYSTYAPTPADFLDVKHTGLGQAEEHGDPGDEHDGATVENTTLLIADLEKQVAELEAELVAIYKEDIEIFTENLNRIDAFEKVRSGLESEVGKLNLDVISLRKRANYYMERNADLFHEVMFYRHQGLFGRLRGTRYEDYREIVTHV